MRITLHQDTPAGTYELPSGPGNPNPPIDPPIINPPIDPIPPGVIEIPSFTGWEWRGSMLCEGAMSFALDFPPDAHGLFRFYAAEFNGPPTARQLVMSHVPGSFEPSQAISQANGNSVAIIYDAALLAGTRVYFNLRNWSGDLNSYGCTPGTNLGTLAGFQPNVG